MAKEVPTTKWCPCCHSSQKIKGFRSFRCCECWKAAGKPKVEVLFKAMDKPEPKKAVKKTIEKAVKRVPEKKVTLIEDRRKPRKKAVKKATKKKVVKKKK